MLSAALHASGVGPSRHFAATQQFSRFRSEADIERFSVCTEAVAIDPKRTLIARASRDQLRQRMSEGGAPYKRLNVRLK